MPRRPVQKTNVVEPMEVDDQPAAKSRKRAHSSSPNRVTSQTKSARTHANSKKPITINGVENGAVPVTSGRSKGVIRTQSLKTKRQTVAEQVLMSETLLLPAKLYTFGSNTCGELGYEADKRRYPFLVPALKDKKVKAVACGGLHTIVLEETGKVYSFGCNDDKALGRPTEEEEDGFEPGEVNLPKKAVQISAGDSHSAALTDDGEVYIWGCFKNENGNFGLVPNSGNDDLCRQEPQLITADVEQKIIKIVSGAHHLVMLAEDGHVYTCGTDDQGQLGREPPPAQRVTRSMNPNITGSPVRKTDKQHLLKPTLVRIGRSRMINIWAGEFSTYILTTNNTLYVCGLNNYCQLGIPQKLNRDESIANNIIPLPTKTNTFQGKSWKQIAAGQHHAVALDDEGKVYTLGRSSDSRLGLGPLAKEHELFSEPTLVPGLINKKCVRVAAGASTSYAVTEDGHLYSWGFGVNFQLATGDDEDQEQPFKCKGGKDRSDIDGKVVCVQAGGQHVAVTITGRIANGNAISIK